MQSTSIPLQILILQRFNSKRIIKIILGKPLGMIFIVLSRGLIYKEDYAFETPTKHFQTISIKGFGIEELKAFVWSNFVLFI
jgi:DNA mismatch repair protein MutS